MSVFFLITNYKKIAFRQQKAVIDFKNVNRKCKIYYFCLNM